MGDSNGKKEQREFLCLQSMENTLMYVNAIILSFDTFKEVQKYKTQLVVFTKWRLKRKVYGCIWEPIVNICYFNLNRLKMEIF